MPLASPQIDLHSKGSQEKSSSTVQEETMMDRHTLSPNQPSTEAQVRYRVGPCRICGGRSGTGTGFDVKRLTFRYT